MYLDFIEAHQFRNLEGKISWGRGINIIHGNNGQGKTNWLEAIYLLSRSKSFRTQRLQEAISFNQQMAFVRGQVSSGLEIQRELQVTLQENSKNISVNGKRESLAGYLSQIQVFAFTAAELEVVRGGPDARRRFIDRGVCSLKPTFVQTLSNYARVIKQKNRILQDLSETRLSMRESQDLLSPWNEQMISLAAEIHGSRSDYVERLNRALEGGLFERRDLSIRYLSSLDGKGDLSDYQRLFRERLELRMMAEITAGHALLGPQRDDLEVLFGGREIRAYGSAGQQRSALLQLDLAAISLYNSWCSEYPLFLIDDVDAELDKGRIKHLLEYLDGRTQTFITTSKGSHIEGLVSDANLYEIEDGRVLTAKTVQHGFSTVSAGANSRHER